MFGEDYSNEGGVLSTHSDGEHPERHQRGGPAIAKPGTAVPLNVLRNSTESGGGAAGASSTRRETVEDIIKKLDEEQGVSGPKGGCCSRMFVPFLTLALIVSIFCVIAWTNGSGAYAETTPRVALIIVEGFQGSTFDDMVSADSGLHLPNIARMLRNRGGLSARCPSPSSTDCARAVLVERTVNNSASTVPSKRPFVYSGSSIASILSGVSPFLHGVNNNSFEALWRYSKTSQTYPSLASRVRDAGQRVTVMGSSHLLSSFSASGRCSQPGVLDMECGTSSAGRNDAVMAEMLECLSSSTCNVQQRKIRTPTDASSYATAGDTAQFTRQLNEVFGGLSFKRDDQESALQNVMGDNLDDSLFIFHFDELAVRAASGALPNFSPTPKGSGANSVAYKAQAYLLDSLIGQVINIVRDRAQAQRENWLVIGLSDVGVPGAPEATTESASDVIPFFMGTYAANSKGYVKLRPLEHPVSQLDVLPTVLRWLDVAPFDDATVHTLEDEDGQYTEEEVQAARKLREGLGGKVQGIMSSGQAMDVVADQCMRRGLHDTASWLGALALDAVPEVLERRLSQECALTQTCGIDSIFSGGDTDGRLSTDGADEAAEAFERAAVLRVRRHHRVALALFHKGEYQRCHYALTKALREYDDDTAAANAPPRPPPPPPPADDAAQVEYASADPRASLFSVSFATSTLPAALQFLCLYVLYMDGQRAKTASSAPHRAINPHLRVLRVHLLGALQNPSNAITATVSGARGGGHSSAGEEAEEEGVGQWGQRRLSHRWSGEGGTTTTTSSSSPWPRPGRAQRGAGASPLEKGGSTDTRLRRPTNDSAGADGAGGSPDHAELLRQDPYLCWLMGVVLRDLGMRQESASYLLASVSANPLLWCAWEDLATLVTREAQLEEIEALLSRCEPAIMVEFFLVHAKSAHGVAPLSLRSQMDACGTRGGGGDGPFSPPAPPATTTGSPQGQSSPLPAIRLVNTCEVLLESFPRSLFLRTQLAGFYYHQRKDLDRAERVYARVHEADPYRLEGVVEYSNILFIRGDRLGLSGLAQRVYQVDPFRAESNFVVGNYYVLLGSHDRSVLHFKRAVAIDPRFVAAWTLLGHAYVETKNTTAAVEAYRIAVALDQRDYRGWYNLGQIYELLEAYHHALYYYWHTTSLRPTDSRMWAAVGNCLEREGRRAESAACFERAEMYEASSAEVYPAIARRIALHHLETHNITRACVYLTKLAASSAASLEDVLFALPIIIQYHVTRARQLMELPARSPSYEPAPAHSFSPSHHHHHPSRGGDHAFSPNAEQALTHLSTADAHLDAMEAALAPTRMAATLSSSAAMTLSMDQADESTAAPLVDLGTRTATTTTAAGEGGGGSRSTYTHTAELTTDTASGAAAAAAAAWTRGLPRAPSASGPSQRVAEELLRGSISAMMSMAPGSLSSMDHLVHFIAHKRRDVVQSRGQIRQRQEDA